ncbi:MAG: hypothetical protein PHG06_22910 [Parabacteroides sp.]|nr:hypothetical protein [Parabacteroides sp.]
MVPVNPAKNLWKFDFSGLPENPQPGQTIEYYLVGYRDDTEVYDKKAFYPSYYYRPPELPSGYNTSNFNYPPMTKTFTIPSPGCNHSWTDCLDAICNICGYTRIAPGHSLSPYGAWIDISTESQCEKQKNVCNNCSYWTWCIDTTHAYTNCADTTCNKCQYSRIAPGHSLSYGTWVAVGTSSQCEKQQIWCNNCSYSNWIFDNTHEYYDCTDSTCTRCGYSRTAPGHSLSPSGSWIDISTASQCEKQKIVCNNCSYSDWVIDTTHAWTNACDTRCNDCNYTRTISHSYTAIGWVDVSQSDICKDYVYRCKICGNSYIAYSDYDHDWSYECDSSCNDCGYTRYANHSYSGSWVNVCTSSICQKYEYECYYCGDSYVSHYDYTHYYPSEFEPICSDCGYRDW